MVLLSLFMVVGTLYAGSKEDALRSATNGCEFARKTLFFTPQEQQRIAALSGAPFVRKHIGQYYSTCAGQSVYGYFSSGKVRTKNQAVMVLVDSNGAILKLEVVHFQEPPEYKAPARWYQAFTGQHLSSDLRLGRDIQALTGATLTARTTAEMVREALAIHQVRVQE